MKYRKLFALCLSVLLLAACFAGCSAQSDGSYSNGGYEMPPSEGITDSCGSNSAPVVTDRKLIRRISINAETEDLTALLADIDAQIAQLGGYAERREIHSGSSYSSYKQSRSANLVIRIPADQLDAFVRHVEKAGNVTSTNESTEDVTLSYVATESRMKALQAEQERLLELIGQAANLTELLELEKRLTEVRTELEEVTSQLKLYDNLVDYGTVELYISEVQSLTPTEEPTFGQRIATGFTNSLKNLGTILKELVILFVICIPYLIPLGIIAGVVVLIVKLATRKKKAKKPPFPTENP